MQANACALAEVICNTLGIGWLAEFLHFGLFSLVASKVQWAGSIPRTFRGWRTNICKPQMSTTGTHGTYLVGRQIPMSSIAHKQCENSFTVFCTNLPDCHHQIHSFKSQKMASGKWPSCTPQVFPLLPCERQALEMFIFWASTSSMFLFMHLGIDFYLYLFQGWIFVSQFLCTSQDLHKEH